MTDWRKPTTNPLGDALDRAWETLSHNPYDGGDCKACLEHDPERRSWKGNSVSRREEGGKTVTVDVYQSDDDDDVWIVDSHFRSQDCDGVYTGGETVTFRAGEVPRLERGPVRDHSAERAGY